MTAQAGAVACDVVWPDGEPFATRVDIDYADELLRDYKWRDCIKTNFLYATPPAAVPVEALEGLVGRLNALEEYADEARVAYAGDHSSGTFRRIAERTQGIRDELTQLIKERSNG